MLLAAPTDTSYKFVFLLHIIAVVVSLAPATAHPLMFTVVERRNGDLVGLARLVSGLPSRVYMIAFLVAGVLGMGLISMSDDVWEWSQTWVWLALVVWAAAVGVQHALLFPAERALAEGSAAAIQRVKAVGSGLTVLVLVLLYLMVFKPGA